jgi:hypothetical protein
MKGSSRIFGMSHVSLKGSEIPAQGLSGAMPWVCRPNHPTGLKGRQSEAG